MFVDYLTESRQPVLLHYAHDVMLADGIMEADEKARMEVLRKQVRAGIEVKYVRIDDLPKLFDRRASRIALFLELTGIGYANEKFDTYQSAVLRNVAYALSLTADDVQAFNSWIKRQFLLVKDAHRLMVEG